MSGGIIKENIDNYRKEPKLLINSKDIFKEAYYEEIKEFDQSKHEGISIDPPADVFFSLKLTNLRIKKDP